ncbi:hypothetical protein D9M71_711600 [compost metagenome]
MFQPGSLALGIGLGRAVAEEIDVEGLCRERTGFRQHGAGLGRGAGANANGPQGAGIGDGSGQGGRGNTDHGRLDDGVFDTEQLGDGHETATPWTRENLANLSQMKNTFNNSFS